MWRLFPGNISMVFIWEFEIESIENVVWNNDWNELIVQLSWTKKWDWWKSDWFVFPSKLEIKLSNRSSSFLSLMAWVIPKRGWMISSS